MLNARPSTSPPFERSPLTAYPVVAPSGLLLPFYSSPVSAGFPSPADDHLQKKLDLLEHIVKHPSATFYLTVKGNSMKDANVRDGDILVVDRAEPAVHNSIVVAGIYDEYVCKRLYKKNGKVRLLPENPAYSPIEVTEEMGFEIFGVVRFILYKAR